MLFMDVAGVITDDLELVNEEVNDFEKIHRMRIVFCIIFLSAKCGFSIKMKGLNEMKKNFREYFLKINMMKFLS